MGELSKKVNNNLKNLTEKYILQMPLRIQEIRGAAFAVKKAPDDIKKLQELRYFIHKLSGSGATFGFMSLSETTKAFELLLNNFIDEEIELDSAKLEQIDSQLILLEKESKIDKSDYTASATRELQDEPPLCSLVQEKTILYLSEKSKKNISEISNQLGYFGYNLNTVRDIKEVQDFVDKEDYFLLIVDSKILAEIPGSQQELLKMKRLNSKFLGIIFISEIDGFDIRLNCVRTGGDAFFTLPLDIGRLIDRIDALIDIAITDPYHILIVDDDPEQVSYYALVLQKAGMITSVASDPRTVLDVLVEAKPELILMDVYMPGCDGPELAAIIRQQEAFVSIPIVFLSFELDKEKQLEAIRKGADDFLTKPIKPNHLITAVKTRAERTRRLRYFMERDSLTGLLNHSNIKEHLGREVMRAKRCDSTVCFAMIDLDHFKKVNDKYGHLIGDRVLKSLSRLLQDRLRRTDIIGRYGGEEFAVILPNTSPENAEVILNNIRINFSQIKQQSEENTFFVTLSCGIAFYPDIENAGDIGSISDKALYKAKDDGRNRVVVYRDL